MPLWVSIPVVAALWLASWIYGLGFASGDSTEAYVVWSVTAIASALLLMRLTRRAV